MPALRISVHEVETENGAFLCMSAGEYTGVFAPMPATEEEKKSLMEEMKPQVQERADYYLGLPDDAELSDDHDISLAEIKESIWSNVVRDEVEPANDNLNKRIARVHATWLDDGASMAGSGNGSIPMSDVLSVEAETAEEAEIIAEGIVKNNPMAGSVRVRFAGWDESAKASG